MPPSTPRSSTHEASNTSAYLPPGTNVAPDGTQA
jgi:hypothetical protein